MSSTNTRAIAPSEFCAATHPLGWCSHLFGYDSPFVVKIAQTWVGVVVQLPGVIRRSVAPVAIAPKRFSALRFPWVRQIGWIAMILVFAPEGVRVQRTSIAEHMTIADSEGIPASQEIAGLIAARRAMRK
jgi:hypothetical protein